MPGVPSGKGCDACVKQKKKCDQSKPACARCARLQIPCIGSGKQRYKFKHVKAGPFPDQCKSRRPSSESDSQTQLSVSTRSSHPSLSRTPSNEAGTVLNEFIDKLEVNDIRFDICWAYGVLLKQIPRRIGVNSALDASVVALTSVASDLSQLQKPQRSLIKYGYALTALRNCLNDPAVAQAPETLCAIYLIWVAQSWLGHEPGVGALGHGAGIVQILTTAPYRNSQDSFEQALLATIAAPVIFESLFNPEVQINPWVKQYVLDLETPILSDSDMRHTRPAAPGRPQMGYTMSCIVRMPDFMRYNPELLYEIRENYTAVQQTSKILGDKYVAAELALSDPNPDLNYSQVGVPKKLRHLLPQRMACYYQRIYAIYLSLETLLNGVLRAYDPNDMQLEQESVHVSNQIIRMSYAAEKWKPIGAGWIPLCLVAVWVSSVDIATRARVDRAWNDLWQDMMPQPLSLAAYSATGHFDQLRMAAMRGWTARSSITV